jgi:4-amino-4-deoxy-L-arabinose transferase-like glycosyltransferase
MIQRPAHMNATRNMKRDHKIDRYGLIGLVLLGFMLWGARSLWDSSEARYGQVAFEMLTSANWLMPTLAGEPHLTKPPFSYWMIAGGMQLFGINAWGARFFLSAFFTGTLLCIRELARTMGHNSKEAWAAAFIFGTSLVPFVGGHTLTTDAFLTFWETLGILAAWKVWQHQGRSLRLWQIIFWGAFGMGFFTKGPPAWLPLIPIAVYLWMRRGNHQRPSLVSLPGIILFLVLSFWWFAVLIARDPGLLSYFLGDELVGRFASTMHDRNDPFWIYAPVVLLGVGPWMVLWPGVITGALAKLRKKARPLQDHHLFLLLWFMIPLGVFTLSQSRMPLYVLPLFAPLSIVMARIGCRDVFPKLQPSPVKLRVAVIGISVWVLVFLIFTAYPDQFPGARSRRPAAQVFAQALARIEEPCTLYWVMAGRQKYSIPFYLQRVVTDAEQFDRHAIDPSPSRSERNARVLYITKAHLLPGLEQLPASPVVHAKALGYAMIEWPPPDAASNFDGATNTSNVGASKHADTRRYAFHAAPHSGLYAALLLILASSRH